jgi:hypothetical protein
MRSWRDPASPWGKQIRFEDREFEAMMDELRFNAGGECFRKGHGVDVDRVMMRALGTEPDFVDLPDGLLGRTLFREGGSVRIEISRDLCERAETDAVARRRLRSTMAHEVGHVACHRCLYIQDTESYSLFDEATLGPRVRRDPIMCRAEILNHRGYTGEWWEYQANRCMAALLLPKRLFSETVHQALEARGAMSFERAMRAGDAEIVVRELADDFDVSLSMTVLRLEELGFIPRAGQGALRFAE